METSSPNSLFECLGALTTVKDSARFKTVKSAFDEIGFGLTLSNSGATQFALILMDPSAPGKVRYQLFDKCGFSSHGTREGVDSVIEDLLFMGFRNVAPQATLDMYSRTREWADGMAKSEIIRLVNCGQLTWEEGGRRIQEINELTKSQ